MKRAAILLLLLAGCADNESGARRCYDPINLAGDHAVHVTRTRYDGATEEVEEFDMVLGVSQIGFAIDYGGYLAEAREDHATLDLTTDGMAWGTPITQTIEGRADLEGASIFHRIVWHTDVGDAESWVRYEVVAVPE
jgi:hypothetical protein